MIFSLLLSLIMPFFMGFLLICFFWPDQRPVRSNLLFKGCLAVGLGFGISSCIFFVWLLVISPINNNFVRIEIGFLIFLISLLLYAIKVRNYSTHSESRFQSVPNLRIQGIILLGYYVAITSAVASFLFLSTTNPNGEWDARAIWNMRARFIFRGSSDQWKDAFSSLLDWSHPDYPLLIPGSIARCWNYIGNETVIIPILLSTLFTFATLGLTISSLSILRSKSQGFLAGLVLLGTPFFVSHGASQYADVPLGFFFLATIVLFCLQERLSKNNCSLLFLAGMTTGLSTWTKNEGFLFLASILVAHFVVTFPMKGRKIYLRQLLSFVTGLLPIIIIVLYFRIQLAPPNDLLYSQGFGSTTDRLLNFSRYFQISKAFVTESIHFGKWGVSLVPILAIYLLCLGIKIEKEDKPSTTILLITMSFMLAGYFFAYVTSPYDLNWHLGTSLNRLFLQLWPSIIFSYFLIVRTPEQTAVRKKKLYSSKVSTSKSGVPSLLSTK